MVECFLQSDVELGLVQIKVREVQEEDEDVDKSVKDILDVLAMQRVEWMSLRYVVCIAVVIVSV